MTTIQNKKDMLGKYKKIFLPNGQIWIERNIGGTIIRVMETIKQ
jgi:hypothetical protein